MDVLQEKFGASVSVSIKGSSEVHLQLVSREVCSPVSNFWPQSAPAKEKGEPIKYHQERDQVCRKLCGEI